MKKKRKISLQNIFNIISILVLTILFIYFLYRFIYYKKESEKSKTYSPILAERIVEQNKELSSGKYLTKKDDIYYFNYDSNNNYLKYKGFLWRIIKINKDNTMTLIMDEPITNMSYDSIYNWLNKSKIKLSGIFESMLGNTEYLTNTKTCIDNYDQDKDLTCNNTIKHKISILSINDYINTGADKGFINNGSEFWISNKYSNNENMYVTNNGEIGIHSSNYKYGIRPTITLNNDIKIISGNGTADNPYYIEKEEFNTLKDVYPGSYISFNDSVWKVVSKAGSKIKIISTECIKDNDGECINMMFAEDSNEINTKEKNLLNYLNTKYYKSIKNNNYITEGPFYIGNYSLIENNYTTCFENTITLKIGLLSVAEPYIYEVPNTFLLTTNKENSLSIYTINKDNILYEDVINKELNIRPALYLKGSLKIIEGKGTYISPYKLGE